MRPYLVIYIFVFTWFCALPVQAQDSQAAIVPDDPEPIFLPTDDTGVADEAAELREERTEFREEFLEENQDDIEERLEDQAEYYEDLEPRDLDQTGVTPSINAERDTDLLDRNLYRDPARHDVVPPTANSDNTNNQEPRDFIPRAIPLHRE